MGVPPEAEKPARAALRRNTAIYAAVLAADLLFVYLLVASGAGGGAYITLTIVALVGLLVAYNVVQHVRDLNAPLVETEGIVVRKWSRAEFIVAWQSNYIHVGRGVFKLGPVDYALIDEHMYVRIVHFPRTLHVVSAQQFRPTALPGGQV